MKVALYARVSDQDSTVENQVLELSGVAARAGWTITATYIDDAISGAGGRDRRPAFDALHRAATRREFDLVAAWSVDRLGRSLSDLVAFLMEMQALGVGLYLHVQAIDTTTPAGKAMYGLLSVFAEFERAMTVTRIHAGLRRARAQGKRLGRPMTGAGVEAAIAAALAEPGRRGIQAIARRFGVGTGTVQRIERERIRTYLE